MYIRLGLHGSGAGGSTRTPLPGVIRVNAVNVSGLTREIGGSGPSGPIRGK
jgi:hypothetical protein